MRTVILMLVVAIGTAAGCLFLTRISCPELTTTEVTPVLEATTPEDTGPAEGEEETVERELPPSGGLKLVGEGVE